MGPSALDVRPSGATQMASGAETRRWLRGRAGVRIIPDAWLVVSMGREPTQAFGARMTPGTSLAVIVSGIPHRTEHPTRPSSPTFVARSMREGLVRFEVAAPNAHRVEISGDFSGWEPVALASVSGGKWRADVRAESGMHRLLMRRGRRRVDSAAGPSRRARRAARGCRCGDGRVTFRALGGMCSCCVGIRTKPPGRVHRNGPRGTTAAADTKEEHVTRHPLILLAGLAAVAAFAGCSQQPTSPRTATVLSGLPAGGNGGPIDT